MRIALVTALALIAAAPAPAQPAAPRAPNYTNDSTWLCLPSRADICSTPLATTALSANGYGSNGKSERACWPALTTSGVRFFQAVKIAPIAWPTPTAECRLTKAALPVAVA